MSWEDVGFVKSSKYRSHILELLQAKPMTPTEISVELKIHFAQVTKNLSLLEKRELVKCITPSLRKGRLYVMSDKGKKTLKLLNSVISKPS